MVDIDIKNAEGKFKFRVCGIIKNENNILLYYDKDRNSYHFPGGHVELGETSEHAVLREIKEEVLVDAKIDKLLCVNENIYPMPDGRVAHEIGYYYILTPTTDLSTSNFTLTENDKGSIVHHDFVWVNLNTASNYNIKPTCVLNVLLQNTNNPQVVITDFTK